MLTYVGLSRHFFVHLNFDGFRGRGMLGNGRTVIMLLDVLDQDEIFKGKLKNHLAINSIYSFPSKALKVQTEIYICRDENFQIFQCRHGCLVAYGICNYHMVYVIVVWYIILCLFQAKSKAPKTEAHKANVQFLHSYLTYIRLTKTVERNLLMVDSLKKNFPVVMLQSNLSETSQTTAGSSSKKVTKPEDLVRIYDIILQVR